MPWRLLVALVAGLVLGGLGILLINLAPTSIMLLSQLTPLGLGVLGRLEAGVHQKHPLLSGFSVGGLAWFGSWLAVLVWTIFTPVPVTEDCFVNCDPTLPSTPTKPFWDTGLAPLVLIISVFALGLGLFYVLVSTAATHFLLKFIRPSTNRPESSREPSAG